MYPNYAFILFETVTHDLPILETQKSAPASLTTTSYQRHPPQNDCIFIFLP